MLLWGAFLTGGIPHELYETHKDSVELVLLASPFVLFPGLLVFFWRFLLALLPAFAQIARREEEAVEQRRRSLPPQDPSPH